MESIIISSNETDKFNDLQEGSPIEVRVKVSDADIKQYQKGKKVEIKHEDQVAQGKIVSDPLEIEPNTHDSDKIISLIIEST